MEAAAAAAAAAVAAGVIEWTGGVIRGLPTKRHPERWHAKRASHSCGEEGHPSRDCPATRQERKPRPERLSGGGCGWGGGGGGGWGD